MTTETTIQKTTPDSIDVTDVHPQSWTYRPQVDIFETPDEILLIADLPGAGKDRLDVGLESGILTLQAEVGPRHPGGAQPIGHEYGVGGFHRRFQIEEAIDPEAVTAEYRHGSLTVHLPKAPQARRRRIPVSA